MEKVALSSANLAYLNSTIKKAQDNINLEKSITQPVPATKENPKEEKRPDVKVVTVAALSLAMLAHLIYNLKKSKPENITDGSTVDKLKDEIEDIKPRIIGLIGEAKPQKTPINEITFKNGIPFLNQTNEVFSGTLVKDLNEKGFFELTYSDGKLLESKKFDKNGNELFKKLFQKTIEDNGDEIIIKTSVERYDNSPIQKLFQETTHKSKNENTILKRCFNIFEINTDTKEAKETTKFAQIPSGLKFLKSDDKRGAITVKKAKDDKPVIKVVSEGFKYIEKKLSFIKDGFKSFIIDSKINPKD